MPYLRNTLAWATPVQVDLLCAHLEAYDNLLPTIIALRLCHRHGAGSGLSRLPVELLVLIEEFLAETERRETRKEWQTLYKCEQEDCSPKDHYDHSRLQDWRRMIRLDTARSEVLSNEDVDERLNDFIMDHTSYLDIHWDRRCNWNERTARSNSTFSLERQELMTKHFGLDLWLTKNRPPDRDDGSYWASSTTLAYLKLPQTASGIRDFELSEQEREDKEFYFSGGAAMEVVGDLALPKDGRTKMERCLRVLSLDPYKHETEGTSELSALAVKDEDKKGSTTWPRLTVLTKIEASTDD